ncbi:MAG TPA: hypothetical protein VH079_02855 [Terriglobales bacterium]|jgi:hypothetical protein|nr:hypothetical protein [Terriglobales bacterium]
MNGSAQLAATNSRKRLNPFGQAQLGSCAFTPSRIRSGLKICSLFLFVLILSAARANAAAALLLEEPYGKLGAFMAQGHAAIYLSRVCAETPLVLRRCKAGESGVVISRYNGVNGYDWIAIPLIPYLYAVEKADDVPLFANPKLVGFLRNQYRRKHLETVAPDAPDGETPTGNWYELVGTSYDRTVYSYEIETSPEQDNALIRKLNSLPNESHFKTVNRNCADFARGIINFYYPKAVRRSIIADAGMTTPKQIAKSLVKFNTRHPELESSAFVIPQVPGTMSRSTKVRGVAESLLKTKKYVIPLAILQPYVAGGIALAYVSNGRFDPSHNAMIMDSERELQPPLASNQRKALTTQLDELSASANSDSRAWRNEKMWRRLEADAEPELDRAGAPVLQVRVGEDIVNVGISRENVLSTPGSPELSQELLEARLREELRRSASSKTSESDVISDWKLLQQVTPPDTAAK